MASCGTLSWYICSRSTLFGSPNPILTWYIFSNSSLVRLDLALVTSVLLVFLTEVPFFNESVYFFSSFSCSLLSPFSLLSGGGWRFRSFLMKSGVAFSNFSAFLALTFAKYLLWVVSRCTKNFLSEGTHAQIYFSIFSLNSRSFSC